MKKKSHKQIGYVASVGERGMIVASPKSKDAFRAFLESVRSARESIGLSRNDATAARWPAGLPHECLYRGHADACYRLVPSLIRSAVNRGWTPARTTSTKPQRLKAITALQDLEAQIFYEFLPRARKIIPSAQNDWDVLFLMRHHGVATRLLDWTQSLGVALYFALAPIVSDPELRERCVLAEDTQSWRGPHIWLLNPYRLNADARSWETPDLVAPRFLDGLDESYGDFLGDFTSPGMETEFPVAVLPETLNDRLNAQRGVFTIHGDLHEAMEDILPRDMVSKVELPIAALAAAIEFLEDAGMSESVLFPDLDALGRDIHRKYRL